MSSKFINPKVIHGKDTETIDVVYEFIDKIEDDVTVNISKEERKKRHILFLLLKALVSFFRWAVVGMCAACIENLFVRFFIHFFSFVLLCLGGYITFNFVTNDIPVVVSTVTESVSDSLSAVVGKYNVSLFARCADRFNNTISCSDGVIVES